MTYTPRPESLPEKVCAFFRGNDEQLSVDDIALKFGTARNSIHTNLGKAVEARLLTRTPDDEQGYLYSAGPMLAPQNQPATTPQPQKPQKTHRPRTVQLAIDPAAVELESGVAMVGRAVEQVNWNTLLDRMAVGQSAKLPRQVGHVLRKQITDRHKAAPARYTTRVLDDSHLRIWRVA
jgi:hypothetical protein